MYIYIYIYIDTCMCYTIYLYVHINCSYLQLREALKLSLNEDTQQRWDDFILGPISELNRRNETNLVSSYTRCSTTCTCTCTYMYIYIYMYI